MAPPERVCAKCGSAETLPSRPRRCADCLRTEQANYYQQHRKRISEQRANARRMRKDERSIRTPKVNRHTSETLASYRFREKYGISACDVAEMAASQGGRCAICGTSSPLVVDHDHTTGRVRALLCRNCNLGLGQFHEDPDRLLAAAAYLLQHSDVLESIQ